MSVVLSSRHNNLAMPAPPRNVLYWSESVNGWWPRISRRHLACGGGWLTATPPDALATGPGAVACLRCAADVAEIRRRRPHVVTPEQWAALPVEVEQGKRPKRIALPSAPAETDRVPCPLCGTAQIHKRRACCRSCMARVRTERSVAAQLVVLLGHGRLVAVTELADALSLTPSGVRSAIKRARAGGRRIVREPGVYGRYRLEVEP